MTEIKEIKESIAKLATDFQEEHSRLQEKGIKNSEALIKMQDDFAKLSEQVQEAEAKANEEKKLEKSLNHLYLSFLNLKDQMK